MAKIVRYNGNLVPFASSSLGTERTLFGGVTQANDITSQFTPSFLRGWGIVGPSDQPTLQDFNAVSYTHGQILAYLHQAGVAEYNSAQEYFSGSITQFSGAMYISLQDANIGNSPTAVASVWWRPAAKGQLLGIQRFATSGSFTYAPTSGTKFIEVFVLGAGGGGGSNSVTTAAGFAAGGGGGNAGAISRGLVLTGFSGLTVTVGLGGAGGVVGNFGNAGANGGASSFGALLTAAGGLGGGAGPAFNTFPAAGVIVSTPATASGGSLSNTPGAVSAPCALFRSNNMLTASGASSPLGSGGGAVAINSAGVAGINATGYGAGGGGAGSVAGAGAVSFVGGNGADGYVEIREYS